MSYQQPSLLLHSTAPFIMSIARTDNLRLRRGLRLRSVRFRAKENRGFDFDLKPSQP